MQKPTKVPNIFKMPKHHNRTASTASRQRRNLGRSSSKSNSSKLWLLKSPAVISNLLARFCTRRSPSVRKRSKVTSGILAPKC